MTNVVSRIISDETLSRIIQIESGGKPNAKAPTSSATGLGQFIESTWMNTVAQHRPDLLKGRTRAEVLAMRTAPALAVEMLARLAEDNAGALGAGYTDGDLYLAHFAGVAAARNLLRTSGDTPVSAIMLASAIAANPAILRGKSAAQVRTWAERKMAAAGGRDWISKWYGAAGSSTGAQAAPGAALETGNDFASVPPKDVRIQKPASTIFALVVLVVTLAVWLFGLR